MPDLWSLPWYYPAACDCYWSRCPGFWEAYIDLDPNTLKTEFETMDDDGHHNLVFDRLFGIATSAFSGLDFGQEEWPTQALPVKVRALPLGASPKLGGYDNDMLLAPDALYLILRGKTDTPRWSGTDQISFTRGDDMSGRKATFTASWRGAKQATFELPVLQDREIDKKQVVYLDSFMEIVDNALLNDIDVLHQELVGLGEAFDAPSQVGDADPRSRAQKGKLSATIRGLISWYVAQGRRAGDIRYDSEDFFGDYPDSLRLDVRSKGRGGKEDLTESRFAAEADAGGNANLVLTIVAAGAPVTLKYKKWPCENCGS
jgi:hypothetical protein